MDGFVDPTAAAWPLDLASSNHQAQVPASSLANSAARLELLDNQAKELEQQRRLLREQLRGYPTHDLLNFEPAGTLREETLMAALGPEQVQSNEVLPTGFTAPSNAQNNGNTADGNENGAPKPPTRTRARWGKATDPHSIAERLRKAEISDRIKNLQGLVLPKSNKATTCTASRLQEIIDYIKFLEQQLKVLMGMLGVVPLPTESENEVSEQEVLLMDIQYLQSKGLCLMPIAVAWGISDQKGTSSAAVRPDNGGTAPEGGGAGVSGN